ncbi:hypothetical protein ACH5RR_029507 [Cinchona calisaya]|uniref:Uncharacterized protein n=1 Tax=Cinchona calisaya TaxID=153742 RepID=A0ABD2YTA2_9GENT
MHQLLESQTPSNFAWPEALLNPSLRNPANPNPREDAVRVSNLQIYSIFLSRPTTVDSFDFSRSITWMVDDSVVIMVQVNAGAALNDNMHALCTNVQWKGVLVSIVSDVCKLNWKISDEHYSRFQVPHSKKPIRKEDIVDSLSDYDVVERKYRPRVVLN